MPYLFNSDGVCEKCGHSCITQSSEDHFCKEGICDTCFKETEE